MTYYSLSFSPVNAATGRIMVSRSSQVDRKGIVQPWLAKAEPITQASVHQGISGHVTSTGEDLILAHDISLLSAEIRGFAVAAEINGHLDKQFDTVAFCSYIKKGYEWARGFILNKEDQSADGQFPINGCNANEKMEGMKFLPSPERTVFVNIYGPKQAPMRNKSKILEGHIKGTPLTGLEVFMALAYSTMYAKSGPELKERFAGPSSVRPELRDFYSSLHTLQALLNLLANVGRLKEDSLVFYSGRSGKISDAEEKVRQIVGTDLMKRMEKELKAANGALRPDEIMAITEEEFDLFDNFTVTSGAKA